MSRWVARGEEAVWEPLADRMKVKHRPTILSHSWSQLVALGQGLSLLTKLVPLTCPNPVCFTWIFLGPSAQEMSVCYWFECYLSSAPATVFCFSNLSHGAHYAFMFLEAEAANFKNVASYSNQQGPPLSVILILWLVQQRITLIPCPVMRKGQPKLSLWPWSTAFTNHLEKLELTVVWMSIT